jgi:hypothetical protein
MCNLDRLVVALPPQHTRLPPVGLQDNLPRPHRSSFQIVGQHTIFGGVGGLTINWDSFEFFLCGLFILPLMPDIQVLPRHNVSIPCRLPMFHPRLRPLPLHCIQSLH